MLTFLLLSICFVLGCFITGLDIAALHRYIHTMRPEEYTGCSTCPTGAATYGYFHMAHHRADHMVSAEVDVQPYNMRQWMAMVKWAVPFALLHERWVGHRTLILGQTFCVLALLTGCSFVGLPILAVISGSLGYLLGSFGALVAYDICHQFTHGGGPYPSLIHARHHRDPRRNYGMWAWNNWPGKVNMLRSAWLLRQFERVTKSTPLLARLRRAEQMAHRTYFGQ